MSKITRNPLSFSKMKNLSNSSFLFSADFLFRQVQTAPLGPPTPAMLIMGCTLRVYMRRRSYTTYVNSTTASAALGACRCESSQRPNLDKSCFIYRAHCICRIAAASAWFLRCTCTSLHGIQNGCLSRVGLKVLHCSSLAIKWTQQGRIKPSFTPLF